MESPTPPTGSGVDDAAFRALHAQLRAMADPVEADRRGALNNLTPQHRLAALGEVREGTTVSLAAPIETEPTPDNPSPCQHTLTGAAVEAVADSGLHFATDTLRFDVHGNADSHIDALCHVVYDGRLYNGVTADPQASGRSGAATLSVDRLRDGIVGRGVLLDIPRLRGVPWIEPGDSVSYDDLVRAEADAGTTVGAGDVLLVRVGHRRRRGELGPWDAASSRAGLHPEAMRYVAERRIAALGSDGNNDTAPSLAPAVEFPVHVLAIHAMGLCLLDYLQLDDLAGLCAARGSWAFLCAIAPLRLPTATGSPVNPIAVL